MNKAILGMMYLLSAGIAFGGEGKARPPGIEPTDRDVKYGAHEKELMNFWQVASEQLVGVLLDIHGGGWMGGKKGETVRPWQMKAGYHHASISYPLVNEGALQPEMLNADPAKMKFMLYDLEKDPEEKHNVLKQHSEVFERLKAELQKLLDDGRSRSMARVSNNGE